MAALILNFKPGLWKGYSEVWHGWPMWNICDKFHELLHTAEQTYAYLCLPGIIKSGGIFIDRILPNGSNTLKPPTRTTLKWKLKTRINMHNTAMNNDLQTIQDTYVAHKPLSNTFITNTTMQHFRVLKSSSPSFYRAMHFSAKRGLAIACRPSVCLSVCDVGGLWSHRLEILEANCTDS